jgi:hypothetical protein
MGQRKYNNYKSYLEANNYELLTTLDDFSKGSVDFQCQYGHTTTLKQTVFGQKKKKYENDPTMLCSVCNTRGEKTQDRFEKHKKDIFEKTGHELLSTYSENSNIKCTYKCKRCSSVNKTTVSNLKKNTGTCPSCSQTDIKNKTELEVIEKFKNLNLQVIEYRHNKHVETECEKGHRFAAVVLDIVNRNRGCPVCAPEKRKQTNIKKYGHENVFQSEQIKQKIKETNLQQYGVDHHMKLDVYKEHIKMVMKQHYGVEYAFHQDYVFEKIRNTCLERYGYKFPLQSPIIQAKITQTFLLEIGAKRPMSNQTWWIEKIMEKYNVPYYCLSDESKKYCLEKYGSEYYVNSEQFKKNCLEKYGSEYYVNSEQSKKDCLEKYGSEYYVNSESYKHYCLEKYGFDHHMKNAEVFSKMIRSCFRRKMFKFPSGRIEYILGYENRCLLELLQTVDENDIIVDPTLMPVFNYEKNNKTSRYFPDILIVGVSMYYIEVKSTWTYNCDIENTHKKIDCVNKAGFDIELWVYENKKEVTKTYYKS